MIENNFFWFIIFLIIILFIIRYFLGIILIYILYLFVVPIALIFMFFFGEIWFWIILVLPIIIMVLIILIDDINKKDLEKKELQKLYEEERKKIIQKEKKFRKSEQEILKLVKQENSILKNSKLIIKNKFLSKVELEIILRILSEKNFNYKKYSKCLNLLRRLKNLKLKLKKLNLIDFYKGKTCICKSCTYIWQIKKNKGLPSKCPHCHSETFILEEKEELKSKIKKNEKKLKKHFI
jgi:hypothetical protein